MAARIIHVEVVGRDKTALMGFYSGLFGWNFNTDNPTGYGIAPAAENGVDTGVGPSQDGGAGHVTFYVAVPDINATLADVTARGGQVIVPRFSPAPDTFLALFADPEGHVIGLTEA